LKHAGVARFVIFKIITNPAALVAELRSVVDARYREPGRLIVINFKGDILDRTRGQRIAQVAESWYTKTIV